MPASATTPTGDRLVVATAPGRVNLIGEHTDYNHGLCLPMALSLETTVGVRRRTDGILRIASDGYPVWSLPMDRLAPGVVSDWPVYAAGVVWALDQLDGLAATERLRQGLSLEISSNVPTGAGLSSSAAVECAVAVSVAEAVEGRWSREELVAACIRAETEMAGAPTGGMDQTVSMFAPESGALLLDFAQQTGVRRTPVALPLAASELALLVIDTGVSHALVDGEYAARRAACEHACAILGIGSLREASLETIDALPDELRRRARHVITENRRVRETVMALENRDWDRVGRLFAESHASMRDDYEISTPGLDAAVTAAVGAGAVAARMTGGGFGGSAVAVVPETLVAEVSEAVRSAFDQRGWAKPRVFEAHPGRPARLLPLHERPDNPRRAAT